MAVIRPFKAFRPRPPLADKVAALPYDVMSSAEARQMVRGNPYSFLHVDKAEIDLDPAIDLYDQKVYDKAYENLEKMIDKEILIQDEKPCLYIYRQVMDGREQTGVVACTSIDDYLNNVIRKHELTRADKEQDRTRHVDVCDANTGPIFLTYRSVDDIDNIIEKWTRQEPVYDILTDDGISHMVWIIDDDAVIKRLEALFREVKYLYIADGHHRSASAVKVGLMRREAHPEYTGEEEFNFFLSVIFPDRDLYIMDYNRVVKDLNSLTPKVFLEALQSSFHLRMVDELSPFRPRQKHHFGMYLEGQWHELIAREGIFDADDPVERLDVSILQDHLLSPLLGIGDPRTDERIDFIGGIRGLSELEERVDQGIDVVAFAMYPTTVQDLMDIADAGKIMPPKSTWFEPKLRSGLFIHKLSE